MLFWCAKIVELFLLRVLTLYKALYIIDTLKQGATPTRREINMTRDKLMKAEAAADWLLGLLDTAKGGYVTQSIPIGDIKAIQQAVKEYANQEMGEVVGDPKNTQEEASHTEGLMAETPHGVCGKYQRQEERD